MLSGVGAITGNNVSLAAGNNLTIGTATSTHSEQHDTTTKTSGVFTSGLNLMIGSSKESQSYTETDTTPQGSVIGNLYGGVWEHRRGSGGDSEWSAG
jgi:filamentous hemagglutinin